MTNVIIAGREMRNVHNSVPSLWEKLADKDVVRTALSGPTGYPYRKGAVLLVTEGELILLHEVVERVSLAELTRFKFENRTLYLDSATAHIEIAPQDSGSDIAAFIQCLPSQLPEESTADDSATDYIGDNVILTTSPEVPGRKISSILGLVNSAGNAAWTIEMTSGRADTAFLKAERVLRRRAARLHADAVVSVTFAMDSSGSALSRSQTITLLGTAVRFEHLDAPQVAD